jgi:hypothetical protein
VGGLNINTSTASSSKNKSKSFLYIGNFIDFNKTFGTTKRDFTNSKILKIFVKIKLAFSDSSMQSFKSGFLAEYLPISYSCEVNLP